MDQHGRDIRVRAEVEILDPLSPGEAGLAQQPGPAAGVPVIAFQGQQPGQERLVAGLLAGRRRGDLAVPFPDRGQPQHPARLLDRRVRGGVGQLITPGSHQVPPPWAPAGGRCSSWS
jgi:hypothetical protein